MSAKERTEEEILARAPIVVKLGGQEYKIAPLVIRDSRLWRKKVNDLIAPFPRQIKVTMENPKDFEEVLEQMTVTMPDQVVDLFFEYAKELPREEIEGKATDAEIGRAFQEVVQGAFPLTSMLPKVMGRLFH